MKKILLPLLIALSLIVGVVAAQTASAGTPTNTAILLPSAGSAPNDGPCQAVAQYGNYINRAYAKITVTDPNKCAQGHTTVELVIAVPANLGVGPLGYVGPCSLGQTTGGCSWDGHTEQATGLPNCCPVFGTDIWIADPVGVQVGHYNFTVI